MTTGALTTATSLEERLDVLYQRPLEFGSLVAYITILAHMIALHEPWADEAQAWQIATHASVSEMFLHALRYEGSPGLWHLVLKGLFNVGFTYVGIHWFCGIIATLSAAAIIYLSPFPRAVRLTLPFTFFLAFQYAVVARSYVLVPLLLFTMAVLWRSKPIYIAVLLGLLANLALHAFAISVGFAAVYAIDLFKTRRGTRRELALAAGLLIALYAAALLTVLPRPYDLTFIPPFKVAPHGVSKIAVYLFISLSSLCKGLARPDGLALTFWPILLIIFAGARHAYYLLPVATFAAFSGYYFAFWHAGLLIPTLITILWIAWSSIHRDLVWPPFVICVAAIIAMQCAWTFYAATHHGYSSAPATAQFLAPRLDAGETIALTYVDHDELGAYSSVALAPYFDHPNFLNQPDPFWIWSRNHNTTQQLLDALATRPKFVMVVFFSSFERFDPKKHLKGIRIEYLQQHGYHLAHTFCGEKAERFGWREESCDLIFER